MEDMRDFNVTKVDRFIWDLFLLYFTLLGRVENGSRQAEFPDGSDAG